MPLEPSAGALTGLIFEHGPSQPASTVASASMIPSLKRMAAFMIVPSSPVVRQGRPERVDVGLVDAVVAVALALLGGALLDEQEEIVEVVVPVTASRAQAQRGAVAVRVRQERRQRLGRRRGLVVVVARAPRPALQAVL